MLENEVPVDIRCFHSLKLTTVTNRAEDLKDFGMRSEHLKDLTYV